MPNMQQVDPRLNSLLLHLYKCVQQPELWRGFLKHLTQSTGADSICMRWVGRNDKSLQHSYSYGLNPDTCTELVRIDPFLPPLFESEVGTALASQTLISDEEYERTDHYEAFFQPQNRFYAMGVLLSNGPDHNNFLGIHRSRAHGSFGEQQQSLLNSITPHLQQAMELQNRIHQLHHDLNQYQNAIGGLATAAWMLDSERRIDWMNNAAHQCLVTGQYGLRQSPGQRLEFDPSNEGMDRELHQFFENQGTHTWLSFPSGDAVLLVTSMKDHQKEVLHDFPVQRRYLAILLDPRQPIVVDQHTLARLYHLSAAESRVVQALMNGLDIKESAEQLCISPHTARTHLRSIFSKTGTNRQTDLVRQLLILSGIRPGA